MDSLLSDGILGAPAVARKLETVGRSRCAHSSRRESMAKSWRKRAVDFRLLAQAVLRRRPGTAGQSRRLCPNRRRRLGVEKIARIARVEDISRPVPGQSDNVRHDDLKYELARSWAPGLTSDGWLMEPPAGVPNTPRTLVTELQLLLNPEIEEIAARVAGLTARARPYGGVPVVSFRCINKRQRGKPSSTRCRGPIWRWCCRRAQFAASVTALRMPLDSPSLGQLT
jgi:hypothetical protein